jgi:integrase
MSKRRGQNEGTIFEEKPGRWVAQLTLGYEIHEGRRRRIRKKFVATTRREVQQKLTAALGQQQTGGAVPIQKDSFGSFLGKWTETLRAKKRSESTISSYAWLIKTYIEPELGTIPITKLTQRDLNEFMQRKLDSGLSPRTVQYCHAVIRSALSKADKDGLVARNVAKLAEPPRQDNSGKVEPLSAVDARTFLAAVKGHRLEALYSVALAIGLRRGEALGLEWSAVNLEDSFLAVTQTVKRINGKGLIIERSGKTQKSLRTIPLPCFAVRVLKEHKQLLIREREFAGDQWREHGLVFSTKIGTPIEPRNLVRHFHAILKLVNIERRRFHDLRHTAASLLIAQGATLHEVKEILGHAQIRLTADLYGHAYMAGKREVVSKMDAVLDPLAPSVAPQGLFTKPN